MTIRISTLSNGLRVVTDSMETVETASIGVWVGVGARNERAEINGVSHFIEHMAFKGTRRRDARAIAEEIEAVGGHLNAYTSREQTAYYAKILKEDIGLALDIIADIVQNAILDPEELSRERTVIIQEIHQANDTPDDIIYDHFQKTAYPDQALGRPVLGYAEAIRDMDRDTLVGYLRDFYRAPNMVLAAAGRLDHDTVVRLAESAFGALPGGGEIAIEPGRYAGGEYREDRDLEQVHVVLGFPGVTYDDEDFYAASVFSTLFGGGMSSRLFQEVREKRGLVYAVHSYVSSYSDTGLFAVYAGTGEKEVGEVMPVICDELLKVAVDVKDEEVARSRAQLKASILMGLESTSSRCEQAARHLMVFGRHLSVEEMVGRVEAVDTEAVRRVAVRLASGKPTLAALGPLGHLESFERIAGRLKIV